MRLPKHIRFVIIAGLTLIAAALPALLAQSRGVPAGEASPEMRAEMDRVREAALKSEYALRQLRHLTYNIGPRLAGSPQAQFAAEYVAVEMRKLGLEATLEKTTVPHWVRGVETGELVEYAGQAPGTTQKVVLTALGGSKGTPAEGITADVVVVTGYDELKARGREGVAGKIVLYNVPFDKEMESQNKSGPAYGQVVAYRGGGAKAAEALGAVAALVRSAGGADYRLPHTGAMSPAGIPAAAVTAEDAEMIAYLAAEGRVRMHLTLTCQTLPEVESANVVADLKGTEHPEQVVIVSGHLDSWDLGTGAIDDGAGVVTAMGTAAVLHELGIRPRRTLRVIAWMNEEHGLNGANSYAQQHAAEFPNHIAAIESDFGAGHPLGLEVFGSDKTREALSPVLEALRPMGAWLLEPSPFPPGADISPLGSAKIPTLALMVDGRTYFDYHHSAADTFDKVDPKNLAENVAVMAVLADALVQMSEPLPR
jgi:Zn-dependent M28 family amino/carboxypeptidase